MVKCTENLIIKETKMTNDDKIIKLKETIAKKKADLGREPKFTPLTSCMLKVDLGINTNIHTMQSLDSVNNALMMLGLYELAAKGMDISTSEVMINGFTLESWITDLKSKREQILYRKNRKELDELESKLDGLMSEKKKTELAIDDIEKMLI